MKKAEVKTTVYTFEDMDVYTIDDGKEVSVYVKYSDDDSAMYYSFGVAVENFGQLSIEALHDNGFFDDLDYCQEAADFMYGGEDHE